MWNFSFQTLLGEPILHLHKSDDCSLRIVSVVSGYWYYFDHIWERSLMMQRSVFSDSKMLAQRAGSAVLSLLRRMCFDDSFFFPVS